MTADPRRVAMISVHTSPLEQPGTGDAGGLNVYVAETAKELATRGIEVDIFTRRTNGDTPLERELAPGVRVRDVTAGPYEGLSKHDLPGQLCAFSAGIMQAGLSVPENHYDLVHSHYWLSGQVGWLAADRWRVALVHTMHTMARVKNRHLASGDDPEPLGREIGEAQVVDAADRLIANTTDEARELIELYDAPASKVSVVSPGVDLSTFRPGDRSQARRAVGVDVDDVLVLFVGRIQPLKAPDLLLRAAYELVARDPWRRASLTVAVVGGPSGSGLARPTGLVQLAAELGIADLVRFVRPVERSVLADWYRAADLVAVPSHSESFGLGRDRGAGLRHTGRPRPTWAACPRRSATPVCWSGATTRSTGPGPSAGWSTTLPGGPCLRAKRFGMPARSVGALPPTGSSRSTGRRWGAGPSRRSTRAADSPVCPPPSPPDPPHHPHPPRTHPSPSNAAFVLESAVVARLSRTNAAFSGRAGGGCEDGYVTTDLPADVPTGGGRCCRGRGPAHGLRRVGGAGV